MIRRRKVDPMKRHAAVLVALAITCVSCASGPTHYGFQLDVRSAPPPPRVVIVDEPDLVVVGSGVYVVSNAGPDYDMFRYGSTYYLCYDGYWYRSSSLSGRFVVVEMQSVPQQVVSVPARHWKHHPHGGPPGQTKKGKDRDRDYDS